jgi:peptide/nickel transport system substrate-binding protein
VRFTEEWPRYWARVCSRLCQPSGGARAPDEPKFGGTLNIVVGVKIEHLDPQWMSSANDVNLSRLYARTLTTFKSGPDAKGEVVGDLATDSGRPVGRNQVWEFTLRRDVKWQDGTPVTCAHVKYGVERNFSRLLTAGSSYPRQLLMDNTPGYEGPFARGNNDGQGLESVQCVDVRTIRFHLNQPMGDFGHAAALAAFAPVLPGTDADKAAYDRRPMSNGPYLIAESTAERIVLERNPHWVRASDSVRKAYPDRIVVSVNPEAAYVAWKLVEDEPEHRNTVQL